MSEMELNDLINHAQQRVKDTQQLQSTYFTKELAMIRIKKEAEKLTYTDWYGIKELDGRQLLEMEEREFIRTLYKAVLKRSATAEDFRIMLGALDYGNAHRIDVIDSVQSSEEAKQFTPITITGLEEARKKLNRSRRLKSMPVIGYILRWCKEVVLLPRELEYLQEKVDNIGKQQMTQAKLQEDTWNLNQTLQAGLQNTNGALQNVNKVLDSYHLSVEAKRLEEQRKVYERRLLDQFYVRYNEELFKESRDLLKERKKIYIEKMNQHFQVEDRQEITLADLGCGTGEWIEVVQEAGYHSIGVDSNEAVVEKDHQLYPGLEVVQQDSIAFLKAQPRKSLDVITSFHMVEHMEMIEVMELCSEAARVLKPNGLLIIETPNPLNVLISSYYFYLDPTHKRQIPPELLEVYVHAGGLKVKERVFVEPLNFVPYEYLDSDKIKDIVFRFNMEQAYSIVAVKE